MGALVHSGTYQGYPGTAGAMRWDSGLEPSSGYIDLNLEDVKKILIDVKPVPWGGNVFPGLISIKAAQSARGTVVSVPGEATHDGPGFAMYGDFVLKTNDDGKPFHQPIRYSRIFIAEAGVEEIQRNLGRVRLHSEGKIRVQLTDIRMFYKKHGALLQKFNVRRPGGEFEQLTLKRSKGAAAPAAPASGSAPGNDVATTNQFEIPIPNGSLSGGSPFDGGDAHRTVTDTSSDGDTYTPWTIQEILKFLFQMLPGAPAISPKSDLMKDQLEVPVDIIGEGEPIIEWIAKLLGQYGYVAQLQPDSQTYLLMRLGKKADYGKIATAVDQWETVEDVHYERKTTWIKNRPPAVSVIGKRRVRRISIPYIPVFQSSDDGMIYKLSAVDSVYGYTMAKLNKQVMVGHEKNFRDVPPLGTAQAFKRGASLRKCAYKMYAPASAFKKGQKRITLQDLQRQAFMPIKKCPVYLDELRAWFSMSEDVEASGEGDKGPFALVPPIVRSYRYGQGFFKDYGAIQKHFAGLVEWADREVNWVGTLQNSILTRLQNPGLMKPQEDMEKNHKSAEKYGSKVNKGALDRTLDGLMIIASRISKGLSKLSAGETMRDEEKDAIAAPTREEQQTAQDMLRAAQDYRIAVSNEFGKYARAFGQSGGVMMKCQLPWGLVERGHYTINTQTGLLMFSEPACRLEQPFLMDHDNGKVRADGAVSVTFGYELNNNTPMDYTTVSFVAEEKNPDDAPTAKCVSLCYPLEMPSHCEHASSLQLYEDETGTPFNQTACITEAASYAKHILEVPHRADGYTYELDGLRAAVLEGGVSSVQHQWDEDGLAYTHVAVNAPYTRGIIPGRMRESWVSSVEQRRRIETSKGNEDQ